MVPSPDLLDRLLSDEGRSVLDSLPPGPLGPDDALAVGTRLRRRFPAELVAAALAQHELRARAAPRFTLAGEMWFTREGLEQASAEPLARHRAGRYAGFDRVADLCCGIGGDLCALAPGRDAVAVDLDPVHPRMARENARVHGAGEVGAVRADVRDLRLPRSLAVFVDPARRAGGRRLAAPNSRPHLSWCLGLGDRVAGVGIKTAPGLPLGLVPPGWEVELLADRRELKEAVLWSPALATTARRATVFPGPSTLVTRPGPPVRCAQPGAFLLDPSPAVTRAGLVEELARDLGAWKLDPRIAFLSADEPLATPFGRLLRVDASLPWSLKTLRQVLRERGVGTVEVRKRGSAVDVADLTARLRLRGHDRAVVVLTRVADRPWALVCAEGAVA
ncbi:MAG TPA: class I SAM-dependent methyltransferase [Actinomycetes bacterium]|nr:class I SAM-dependent methyltransferase [Actinomycetes bacterium]